MHTKKIIITLNKKETSINNSSKNNNNYQPLISTVVTSSLSLISKKWLKDNFERLIIFHQIFFRIDTLDNNNNNIQCFKEKNVSYSSI